MTKEKTGFLKGAYELSSAQENRQHYNEWAQTYDDDMVKYNYVAPIRAATMLARKIPNGNIIDIGCGTGLAGEALKQCGGYTLDGTDISKNMLRHASEKNIYQRLWAANLLAGLDVADNAYDGGISVGAFTVGHIGPAGLAEFFRVIKPGGAIVLTVNEIVYEKEQYPARLQEWETAKKIALLECKKDAYIVETGTGGFYIALRVLT